MVEAKLKSLKDEAERMYPYSKHSKSVTDDDIVKK